MLRVLLRTRCFLVLAAGGGAEAGERQCPGRGSRHQVAGAAERGAATPSRGRARLLQAQAAGVPRRPAASGAARPETTGQGEGDVLG